MDVGYSENHRGKVKSYRKSKHGSLKKSGSGPGLVRSQYTGTGLTLPRSLCTHGAINGAAIPYGPPVVL